MTLHKFRHCYLCTQILIKVKMKIILTLNKRSMFQWNTSVIAREGLLSQRGFQPCYTIQNIWAVLHTFPYRTYEQYYVPWGAKWWSRWVPLLSSTHLLNPGLDALHHVRYEMLLHSHAIVEGQVAHVDGEAHGRRVDVLHVVVHVLQRTSDVS